MNAKCQMLNAGFLIFFLLAFALPASAEAIPEDVLNHDYLNCMGGQTAFQDPKRDAYCNCMRNKMRSNWSAETYIAVAMEQMKASNAAQVPQAIKDLAQGCLR